MKRLRQFLKYAVTSSILIGGSLLPVGAGIEAATEKLDALAQAEAARAQQLQQEIIWAWERSESDAMDLLYERGRAALEAGEFGLAIEHFTALVDHAPSFVQGYDGRAQAYIGAGLLGPALHDIGTVLSAEPRHFLALARLAQVLEATGKQRQALAALRKLEAVHPHFQDLGPWMSRLELAQQGPAL